MGRQYPKDADGDALQRIADAGNDLSQPIRIDFFVSVGDEDTGRIVESKLQPLGYDVHLDFDCVSSVWTVRCTREMLATYEGVVGTQAQISDALAPIGLICDEWGTFGV